MTKCCLAGWVLSFAASAALALPPYEGPIDRQEKLSQEIDVHFDGANRTAKQQIIPGRGADIYVDQGVGRADIVIVLRGVRVLAVNEANKTATLRLDKEAVPVLRQAERKGLIVLIPSRGR